MEWKFLIVRVGKQPAGLDGSESKGEEEDLLSLSRIIVLILADYQNELHSLHRTECRPSSFEHFTSSPKTDWLAC